MSNITMYNKGNGGLPKINDRVFICHTNSELDGMTGTIIGWVHNQSLAILLLDEPNTDQRGILMGVVCLDIMKD